MNLVKYRLMISRLVFVSAGLESGFFCVESFFWRFHSDYESCIPVSRVIR